jgi:hypothetical protein
MSNPTGKGGFQERKHQINRKGRPGNFDALRELAQQIGHEPLTIGDKRLTVTEAILRQWAQSKNPQLQRAFIEIAYGKVPDKLDVTGMDKIVVKLTQADE